MLGNNVCLAIVGNKVDLLVGQEKNQLSNDLIVEAKQYAQTVGATHHLTSARTNYKIDELFADLTKGMSSYKFVSFNLIIFLNSI